ncbi:MAG: methyltransferase [Deltaproteobacteria bacterium]|jgi:ribosomal protein L11 methyltransferase|nr:methyltransferase [Deltaproteobacteria bacterium]MBT4263969.1 methyltransferase [Deltaproteobacteria bacterium]MBT4639912.1 methyltransferase [Deltaproteobacteria bacterium]MBT6498524.1 methyltransferase [Deltaproteobacteria bacterium]MBT6616176.1 methyltransferase [Deltaproteobacteria bacterium]
MKKEQVKDNWYWELTGVCRPDDFDLVSYYLFEQGASGVEEINEESSSMLFRAFFPSTVSDPAKQLDISIKSSAALSNAGSIVQSIEKKELQNWQEGWKDFFKPLEIGETLLIRPPWEPSQAGKNEIIIYPGQGFGTGYHESTHLALLLLEWVFMGRQIANVIDVGTGSGILAIAALLLGADHITAIDTDSEALSEVSHNLTLSKLDDNACTLVRSGPDALKNQAKLVMANIEGHILEKLADDLKNLICKDGYLVLSGVLIERQESLLKCFQNQFDLIKMLQKGEWSGFVLHKTG